MDAFALVLDPSTETDELEKQLLSFLNTHPKGVDISTIVKQFEKDCDQGYIKQVVWKLISLGEIRLTPERNLVIQK